jgi:hypothetical protein
VRIGRLSSHGLEHREGGVDRNYFEAVAGKGYSNAARASADVNNR